MGMSTLKEAKELEKYAQIFVSVSGSNSKEQLSEEEEYINLSHVLSGSDWESDNNE